MKHSLSALGGHKGNENKSLPPPQANDFRRPISAFISVICPPKWTPILGVILRSGKYLQVKKCFFLPTLIFFNMTVFSQGYSIKGRVKPWKDTVCYLGNYFADKQYVKDTAKIDRNGKFIFEGKEKLPGGIYLVVLPDKKFFELIIDKEQHFSFETDSTEFVKYMKIKGADDNNFFYTYLNSVTVKYKEAEKFREEIKKHKNNKDSVSHLEKEIQRIDSEVKYRKLQYIKEHSQTLLAKVFKAAQEPEIPEAPLLPNGKKDSTFAYRYFKKHYFDNIDLTDDRLLRTPVFYRKINDYLDRMVVQIPDSINKEIDTIVEKSSTNKDVFKYLVSSLTYNYENSKVMGFDAVFVHMIEKYYMTHRAFWVDSVNLYKITQRATTLKPLLIGKKAPNIILPDSSNKLHFMYDVKSPYTVLYFFDPDCSHCKKITPKLKTFYDTYKSQGVEIFAIDVEHQADLWKKYIRELKLNWINVMDPSGQISFRVTYDIYSTPVIYLLDENKKIIAKRLDVEQLQGLLDSIMKEKK